MKSIFIAGSRKFYEEIEKLVQQLKDNKIKVATAGKWDNSQKDTLESEKTALLNAFQKIDEFDICYIYSKDGYIGKTVAMEIAYAYAKKKELISSHKIEEFSAQALISKIMSSEELIKHCKRASSD
jgi:Asp-tRNA(Asn)/Glu-tRNA(Gln) amidotransferase B subunit